MIYLLDITTISTALYNIHVKTVPKLYLNTNHLTRLVRPCNGLSKPLMTGIPARTLFLKAKK